MKSLSFAYNIIENIMRYLKVQSKLASNAMIEG
jgi:hypothetical protein